MNYKGTRHDSMRQSYYFFLFATGCLFSLSHFYTLCDAMDGILNFILLLLQLMLCWLASGERESEGRARLKGAYYFCLVPLHSVI